MTVRIQSFSQPRRSNHRATLAVFCGVVAVAVVPVAVELTRRLSGAVLLDAAWAIPVAAIASLATFTLERGARGIVSRTLDQARGLRRVKAARILAVAGICLTLSASIAVGLYELLLRLEH